MNQPQRFFENGAFIREIFDKLRDKIVTLHLKDIAMETDSLTVAFREVLLGTGGIDYPVLMEEISKLPKNTPAMLEHLHDEAEYDAAAAAVVRFMEGIGLHKEGMCWVK